MDHRDRIESPSVERKELLELRMEMIATLMNQMSEGGNKKQDSETDNKRKHPSDCYGIMKHHWLAHFVNVVHRMFTL
ncbi:MULTISPECIES: hypothetical protein [Bacillales]|uniref:hypothetical protein n=1 Tax=Bacillales TaxID=1385 RepID=UPI0006A7A3B9|nr:MULTISPECIES: hypothetical protein [Bacillales]OBZ08668.1 hypothetical protein A7975_26710 [Bacillus sp. FJAT-26390]